MKRYLAPVLLLINLLFSSLLHAGGIEALFAPSAEPWAFWEKHSSASTKKINHQAWDKFLNSYVIEYKDNINRVAYDSVTTADKQSLVDYINALQGIDIHSYNRSEQLAYWINLYNAVTVKVILDHYPVKSIRDIDISPGFFADGPWGKKLLTIKQQAISLNDIEHRILRPIWDDPRIHYAVNCASLGCPNLRTRAYTASTVNEILDLAAREYVNHPRGVLIDDGTLFISSIYSWFQSDFGGNEKAVIQHLKKYARPHLSNQLDKIDFINGDDYDWALNDHMGKVYKQ